MSAHPSIADRPHYVYRAYTVYGTLLYVGCTCDLPGRKRDHRSWSDWFAKAKRWRVEGPYDYRTARDIELVAIHAEQPKHNITGTPRARRNRRRLRRAWAA